MYYSEDIPKELIVDVTPIPKGRLVHKYIRGPIPLWWVNVASLECRPTALRVGLLLFYREALKWGGGPLKRAELDLLSLHRSSAALAVGDLLRARLISVEEVGRRKIPRLDMESRKPIARKEPHRKNQGGL